jgi:hypothetical protein
MPGSKNAGGYPNEPTHAPGLDPKKHRQLTMLYSIPFAKYLLPLALLHVVGTLLFQGTIPAAQIGLSYAVLAVGLATLAFLFVMSCLAVLAFEDYRPRSFPWRTRGISSVPTGTPVQRWAYKRQAARRPQ